MRALLIPVLLVSSASAAVSVAPLFSDHAVLQRDRPVPVWGRAAGGETVKVTFHGETVATRTNAQGRWEVKLPAMAATSDGADLVIEGSSKITLHDVVVGEVWLCSGQSNMGFVLSRALNAPDEIAASANPLLRELTIGGGPAAAPVETVRTSGWVPAAPQTTANFTAVGYFFARELIQKLHVPVGLIKSASGGTPVEAWMSAEAFAGDPAFAAIAERSRAEEDAMSGKGGYPVQLAAWQKAAAAAGAAGPAAQAAFLKDTPQPLPQPHATKSPMVLFNGKIAPVKPYAFRGVLWYQGEANSTRPQEYHALFSALITTWRAYFGVGDFPFYWVQLPNFAAGDAGGLKWAALREAQSQTLALPNTGQAIAIDVGEADNIHPLQKVPVGHRLALLAETGLYGFTDEASGPVFKSAARTGREFT
ncbi:MAG: hypothetical protein JWQ83_1906, partial [Lacunisphaera sp.]|nr:hypothetical protein [Lacunisphaera sp.]